MKFKWMFDEKSKTKFWMTDGDGRIIHEVRQHKDKTWAVYRVNYEVPQTVGQIKFNTVREAKEWCVTDNNF